MADKIVFGVEFDAKTGLAQLKQFKDETAAFGAAAKKAGEQGKQSFGQMIVTTGQFTTILSNLKGAFTQVLGQFSEAISLSNQYESALVGLSQTADKFGQSQTDAKKAALELSKDGLISVTSNATALKFLLQSGFDMSQSLNITKAAKDMGAFGRVTQDFNQAMIDFARGVKTGSMELTENIGFTQRFSAIMKRANVDISEGIDLRNNLAQREAFYNAVLAEGELVKGNANKYMETSAGAMAAAGTQIQMLRKDIGDFVKIIVAEMLPSVISVVKWLKDNLAVVIAGLSASIALTLVPSIGMAISALASMGITAAIATGGITVITGAIAAFIAYKYADKMIENAKATQEFNTKVEEATDSVNGLTEAQLRNKKIKAYSDMSKMSFALSEINTQIIKQIELQDKANRGADSFGFEKAQRNIELLREEKKSLLENIKIKQAERDATDKALTATKKAVDPKELTESEINAQQKALDAKKKAENQLFFEIMAEEKELTDQKAEEQQKRVDNHAKAIEKQKQKEIEAFEAAMDAEMQAYITGKTEQQVMEEQWTAFQIEERKKAAETAGRIKANELFDWTEAERQGYEERKIIRDDEKEEIRQNAELWADENQMAADIITGSVNNVANGFVTMFQVGISGGNALKAAFQSFSQSILAMIAQIIAKALVMKALLALGNAIGGGIGGFLVSAATGEKGGLPSQFRPKLAGGGVLWRGNSHANGGIPVEVEGDEITLTKGVYRNPVLRGIASMINVAAGGISIPNSPRATMLEAGGLPALTSASGSSDNSMILGMISNMSTAITGLNEQINRFKAADNKQVWTMSALGQKEVAAVV